MSLTNRLKAIILLPVLATALSTGPIVSGQEKDKGITSYCQEPANASGRYGIELPSGQVVQSCFSFDRYVEGLKENAQTDGFRGRFGLGHDHRDSNRKLTDAFTKLDKPYPASFCIPVNYTDGHSRALITLLHNSKGDKSYSLFQFRVQENEKDARKNCADFPGEHEKYNEGH